jgi:hypothetical protein
MTRLFVLFAALAALSTVVAANAFAAGGGTTTCSTDWVNIPHPVTMVNGNLDVPAGTTCKFAGEVTGNVTVEGTLAAFGAQFDKNLIVNGGRFGSANWGSTILGNLNITGSQGNPGAGDLNGFWSEYSDSHIDGNVNYSGNAIPLYFQGGYAADGHQYKTMVEGNFNYSGSPAPVGGPLEVHGQQNIS